MEIDEPATKKIRECGAKETQLSLVLVIIASCLISPITICEFFLYENLIEMRRVVTWYMGSGLKAQNMTGIRAQSKGLRAQKNGIRDRKAFEPESGIRFITRSKNLLSHYFSA